MRFRSVATNIGLILGLTSLAAIAAPTLTSASPKPLRAASAAIKPLVVTCLGRPVTKPADDVADCDQATVAWRDVRWKSWGAHTAKGVGKVVINACKPNCAHSSLTTHPAKVTLTKVVAESDYGAVFSKAVIKYKTGGATLARTSSLLGGLNQKKPKLKGGEFYSPISGVGCEVDFTKGGAAANSAYCQRETKSEKHNASIKMTPKGKLTRCVTKDCIGNAGEDTPTLKYGQVDAIGPYRCLSSKAGVICTVPSGLGFLISPKSLARIRGY